MRIGNTKRDLQEWNKSCFRLCHNRLTQLRDRLAAVQNLPLSEDRSSEESELQGAIEQVLEQLDNIWRQKSRELWLSHGDRNTKFFHALTVIRMRRSFIWGLKDGDGSLQRGRNQMASSIKEKFLHIFSPSRPSIPDTLES